MRVPDRLPALLRYASARVRGLLLGAVADNLVFRQEVGLDSFGRLRPGSPILRAHGVMAAWLALEGVILAIGGWRSVGLSLSGVMALLALGTYPLAARRAFENIERDRTRGTLDQLALTGLSPGEIFEGKYFGLLAPLTEMRRYLTPAGALFAFACLRLFPAPWVLLAIVLWATAINHVAHSAVLGTLAGLRRGLRGGVRGSDLPRDWRLNPWPDHLLLNLKIGAMLAPALAFLLWLGSKAEVVLFAAFGLMLLMPFYVSVRLRVRHQREIEHLRSTFRAEMEEGNGAAGDSRRGPNEAPAHAARPVPPQGTAAGDSRTSSNR